MTVIARRKSDDTVFVIVKGSPSKVAPLLDPSYQVRASSLVSTLASDGLRILMFAWKEIPSWDISFKHEFEARRNEEDPMILEEMLPILETDMDFLGVTGTQDNLHPLVDQTIIRFQEADVKTFLCTGDIRETATNIGYNSAILPHPIRQPHSRVFDISIDSSENIHQQLNNVITFSEAENSGRIGVVLGHNELPQILNSDHLSEAFVEVISRAHGIVIARADPEMKLAVTRFLMNSCGYTTMAVGDGANDIPMLRAAHVSVGIKSGENQNAAAASDLAIRIVTDLPQRVFDLSPTFWRRNSKIPKFISSMKMTVISTLLIFDIVNGFQGKSMFTGTQLLFFNAFYGWSVLVYGITYRHPALSKSRSDLLQQVSPSAFFEWVFKTIFDTTFAFMVSHIFFSSQSSVHFFGDTITAQSLANWILLVCITNSRISLDVGLGLESLRRNKWIHLSVVGTILVFLLIALLPRLLEVSGVFLFCLSLSFVGYLFSALLFQRILNILNPRASTKLNGTSHQE